MTELRDDELLARTPQEVIDALGFDPRELDEAQESAVGIMPGGVPNLTGWPRRRAMLGETWDETKVNRDAGGRFDEKAGGGIARRVELDGIENERLRSRVVSVIGDLQKKYKPIRINKISLGDLETNEGARADTFTTAPKGMTFREAERDGKLEHDLNFTLNRDVWRNVQSMKDSQIASRLLNSSLVVDPSACGMLTHEYGHLLDKQYGNRELRDALFHRRRDDLRLLSDYAASSPKEMFAEMFVLYDRLGPSGLKNLGGADFSEFEPLFARLALETRHDASGGFSGHRRQPRCPPEAGVRSQVAADRVVAGARPVGAVGRQVGGPDNPGPLSRHGGHVRDSAPPQTLGRIQESVASSEWAVVLEGDADWDPNEHPREDDGQFAKKGSGETGAGPKDAVARPPESQEQWFGSTLQFAKRLKDDWPRKLRAIMEEYRGRKYDDEEIGRLMDVIGPTWKVDDYVQVANKINVVREIGARLDKRTDISQRAIRDFAAELEGRGLATSRRPTKATAEYAADIVLGIWSSSSSDGNPASQALQAAVAEVMGVQGFYDPIGNMKSDDPLVQGHDAQAGLKESRDEILSKHGPVLRAIVQEIYQNTQDQLKELGVEQLVLFRGMALAADDPLLRQGQIVESHTDAFYREAYPYRVARDVPLRMQPISSFSASLRTAGEFSFGERGRHHAIVAVTVPREKIFSSCLSGMGCLAEAEIVVLHHDQARGSVVIAEYDDMNFDKARRLGDPSTVWSLLHRAEQAKPASTGVAESAVEPPEEFVLDLDADQRNADWIDRRKEPQGGIRFEPRDGEPLIL